MNNNENNGLKYFVIIIGWIMWFPLAYYTFVSIHFLTTWLIEKNLFLQIFIYLIVFFIWLLRLHKILLSLIYVSFQKKIADTIYCLLGLIAFILFCNNYYEFYIGIFNNGYIVGNEFKISIASFKGNFIILTHIMLMLIFIPNYIAYPLISKNTK